MTKTFIIDVDGVLLDFDGQVKKWAIETGRCSAEVISEKEGIPGRPFESHEWKDILGENSDMHIEDFTLSIYAANMSPLPKAAEAIDLLVKNGYELIVCTAFGTNRYATQARIDLLKRKFGENTFSGFIFCPFHEGDKVRAIRNYYQGFVPQFEFLDDSRRKVTAVSEMPEAVRVHWFANGLKDEKFEREWLKQDKNEIIRDGWFEVLRNAFSSLTREIHKEVYQS